MTTRVAPSRIVAGAGVASAVAYAALYAANRAMFDAHGSQGLALPVTVYLVAAVILVALLAWIVLLAFRGRLDRRAARLALAFALLFQVGFAFGRPSLSIDVYSYIAQGYEAAVGDNPYMKPISALNDSNFGSELRRAGWLPVHGISPYGPLWTLIERAVARSGASVPAQASALKMIVLIFSLGDAALIWLILSTLWPAQRLTGTLLFAWNPVVVLQLAADGHNDAAMLCLLLLSLLLAVCARPAASAFAMAMAGLFKITALVLAPLAFVYFWKTSSDRRKLMVSLAGAGAAAVAIAAAAYAPFWVGANTFHGITEHATPTIMPSTPGVLYWYLTRTHGELASSRLLSFLTAASLSVAFVLAAAAIRDRVTFVRASGWLAAFAMLIAPGYWPWYAIAPLALFALAPDESAIAAVLAISIGSLLAAPIDILRIDGLMDWEAEMFATTLLGLWAPALFIAARSAAVFVGSTSLAWPRDIRRRQTPASTRGTR